MRLLVAIGILSIIAGACQPEMKLGDLSRISLGQRNEAEKNWDRIEKAFKGEDHRSLENLIGCQVLILVDASGSPWRGKALSVEERAESAGDATRLTRAQGEHAVQIARGIRARRDKAWQVACRVDFTKKQVREHFIWPDAVFTAHFELIRTLTEASISDRSVRIKPVAIEPMILQL